MMVRIRTVKQLILNYGRHGNISKKCIQEEECSHDAHNNYV